MIGAVVMKVTQLPKARREDWRLIYAISYRNYS